jgi:hypothetical protein
VWEPEHKKSMNSSRLQKTQANRHSTGHDVEHVWHTGVTFSTQNEAAKKSWHTLEGVGATLCHF